MSRVLSGGIGAVAFSLAMAACLPPHTVSSPSGVDRPCLREASPAAVELRWLSPVNDGDNRRLEDWCRTVGPPVIELEPTFEGSFEFDGDSLRVISWNVNAGGGDLLAFLREEGGLACARAAHSDEPALARDPLVVLVQEAFRTSSDMPSGSASSLPKAVSEEARPTERLDLVSVARRCGLAFAYVPSARNGAGPRGGLYEDKGNAILSTVPLVDVAAIELPFEGARRVAVVATIDGPAGRPRRVASAHFLSTARPWRVLVTGNGSRLREASALLEALDRMDRRTPGDGAADGASASTILGGDLNTWSRRETALAPLRGYFRDSPPALTEPTRGAFPTDHILFRAGEIGGETPDRIEAESYRRIGSTYYSDHHPIAAWVHLGG